MPQAVVNQMGLYYRVQGQGPDVLLLHGLASSWRMWQRPMDTLSQAGLRVWALDLPGHGNSAKPSLSWYSIANLAFTVAEFIQKTDMQPPVVIAHSMGGAVTLDLFRQCPGLVGRMVLAAPAVSGKIGYSLDRLVHSTPGRWLASWVNRLPRNGRYLPGLPIFDPALRRRYQDLTQTTLHSFIGCLRAVADFDFSEKLSTVNIPTLVIVGMQDKTLPPSEAELAARHIPHAQLVRLAAGHEIVDEQPECFEQLVLIFLNLEVGN
jgi:3-oxoadipate enol-lactonase